MNVQNTPPLLGFGGYRVNASTSAHRTAIQDAILGGVRLLDTSANYTDGGSERLFGAVIQALVHEGRVARADLTVVTKAGYLQGANLAVARERTENGNPFTEVVRLDETLAHCISPDFLEDQITRSLERLNGAGIDLLLLHNPEYFLKRSPDHREYYRRIEQAFRHLETEVETGRIAGYGVSSNTFGQDPHHAEFTSLEVLLEIADRIAADRGRHHFRAIQFPLNLFEVGPALLTNNGGLTVLELATKHGLLTLANRPLNAFTERSLVRLADYPNRHGIDVDEFLKRTLLQAVRTEGEAPTGLLAHLKQAGMRAPAWAHRLHSQFQHLVDVEQWRQILQLRIHPELEDLHQEIEAQGAEFDAAQARVWWEQYWPVMNALLSAVSAWMEDWAARRSRTLLARMTEAAPALKGTPTLSQAALRVYRATPGLSAVLLGMRKSAYVQDALAAWERPLLPAEQAIDAYHAAQAFLDEWDAPAEAAPSANDSPKGP